MHNGAASRFSVVIVCKDAATHLHQVLAAAVAVTDDVVVYDSGSTDGSIDIIKQHPVRLVEGPWAGYGPTKQKATALARYDWVLSLDADEVLDAALQQSLLTANLQNVQVLYRLKRINHLGSQPFKWGEFGRDHPIRFFNRTYTTWNNAAVHEAIQVPAGAVVKTLPGCLLHYTMRDETEFREKTERYAALNAQKGFERGKKSFVLKPYLSAVFTFTKFYLLRLGFLDGAMGLMAAKMSARSVYLKQKNLLQLWRQKRGHT